MSAFLRVRVKLSQSEFFKFCSFDPSKGWESFLFAVKDKLGISGRQYIEIFNEECDTLHDSLEFIEHDAKLIVKAAVDASLPVTSKTSIAQPIAVPIQGDHKKQAASKPTSTTTEKAPIQSSSKSSSAVAFTHANDVSPTKTIPRVQTPSRSPPGVPSSLPSASTLRAADHADSDGLDREAEFFFSSQNESTSVADSLTAGPKVEASHHSTKSSVHVSTEPPTEAVHRVRFAAESQTCSYFGGEPPCDIGETSSLPLKEIIESDSESDEIDFDMNSDPTAESIAAAPTAAAVATADAMDEDDLSVESSHSVAYDIADDPADGLGSDFDSEVSSQETLHLKRSEGQGQRHTSTAVAASYREIQIESDDDSIQITHTQSSGQVSKKNGRGRPPKSRNGKKKAVSKAGAKTANGGGGKGRGRPRKNNSQESSQTSVLSGQVTTESNNNISNGSQDVKSSSLPNTPPRSTFSSSPNPIQLKQSPSSGADRNNGEKTLKAEVKPSIFEANSQDGDESAPKPIRGKGPLVPVPLALGSKDAPIDIDDLPNIVPIIQPPTSQWSSSAATTTAPTAVVSTSTPAAAKPKAARSGSKSGSARSLSCSRCRDPLALLYSKGMCRECYDGEARKGTLNLPVRTPTEPPKQACTNCRRPLQTDRRNSLCKMCAAKRARAQQLISNPHGRHCANRTCATDTPDESDGTATWHRIAVNTDVVLLCVDCYKAYEKGQYCPFCTQVWLESDDDKVDGEKWIFCEGCEQHNKLGLPYRETWAHVTCVSRFNIDPKRFICATCDPAFLAQRRAPQFFVKEFEEVRGRSAQLLDHPAARTHDDMQKKKLEQTHIPAPAVLSAVLSPQKIEHPIHHPIQHPIHRKNHHDNNNNNNVNFDLNNINIYNHHGDVIGSQQRVENMPRVDLLWKQAEQMKAEFLARQQAKTTTTTITSNPKNKPDVTNNDNNGDNGNNGNDHPVEPSSSSPVESTQMNGIHEEVEAPENRLDQSVPVEATASATKEEPCSQENGSTQQPVDSNLTQVNMESSNDQQSAEETAANHNSTRITVASLETSTQDILDEPDADIQQTVDRIMESLFGLDDDEENEMQDEVMAEGTVETTAESVETAENTVAEPFCTETPSAVSTSAPVGQYELFSPTVALSVETSTASPTIPPYITETETVTTTVESTEEPPETAQQPGVDSSISSSGSSIATSNIGSDEVNFASPTSPEVTTNEIESYGTQVDDEAGAGAVTIRMTNSSLSPSLIRVNSIRTVETVEQDTVPTGEQHPISISNQVESSNTAVLIVPAQVDPTADPNAFSSDICFAQHTDSQETTDSQTKIVDFSVPEETVNDELDDESNNKVSDAAIESRVESAHQLPTHDLLKDESILQPDQQQIEEVMSDRKRTNSELNLDSEESMFVKKKRKVATVDSEDDETVGTVESASAAANDNESFDTEEAPTSPAQTSQLFWECNVLSDIDRYGSISEEDVSDDHGSVIENVQIIDDSSKKRKSESQFTIGVDSQTAEIMNSPDSSPKRFKSDATIQDNSTLIGDSSIFCQDSKEITLTVTEAADLNGLPCIVKANSSVLESQLEDGELACEPTCMDVGQPTSESDEWGTLKE